MAKRRYRRKANRRYKRKKVSSSTKKGQQILQKSANKTLTMRQNRDIWTANLRPPPKNRLCPFPDIWITELQHQMQLHSAPGLLCTGGNFMHFEFAANNPYGTFSSTINVTNANIASAAICGTWTPDTGQFLNDAYPWMNAFAALYQKYMVYDSRVVVKVHCASTGDPMDVVLVPITNNTLLVSGAAANPGFKEMSEYKHAKLLFVRPSNQIRATVSNKFQFAEFYGTQRSIDELVGDFAVTMGSAPAAGNLNGYSLGFRILGGANNLTVNLDIRMYQKIVFLSPIQRAT